MSAERPSPALDPGHPLHSILSGFAEPRDDVLADDERSGADAIVEQGPPRPPSAGRPIDDDAEPFTPPVPVARIADLLTEDIDTPRRRWRAPGGGVGELLAGVPRLSRPRAKVAATLSAVVISVAVVAAERRESPRGAGGTSPSAQSGDGDSSSPTVVRAARRRGKRPPVSRARSSAPPTRAPTRRARAAASAAVEPHRVSTATSTPAQTSPPLAAATSRFTSEFTP